MHLAKEEAYKHWKTRGLTALSEQRFDVAGWHLPRAADTAQRDGHTAEAQQVLALVAIPHLGEARAAKRHRDRI